MPNSTTIGMAQKQLAEINKLENELREFGVYPILLSEKNRAKKFLERIRKNARLADACRKGHENGTVIVLLNLTLTSWLWRAFGERSVGKVREGFIFIDVGATDQEIINFLNK